MKIMIIGDGKIGSVLAEQLSREKDVYKRQVYDGFDLDKVCAYGEEKIAQLLSDEGIIRNRLKIRASIKNSRIFRDIQEEYGGFDSYIWGWTGGKIIHENNPAVTTSPLSDAVSRDLKKRGMTFVGSTIIYAYLQALSLIHILLLIWRIRFLRVFRYVR